MRDICNSGENPEGFKSLKDMIMESSIYEDDSDAQYWGQLKDKLNKGFWSADIMQLDDLCSRLNEACSPSEYKINLYNSMR